jgi:polar amino acid transport system permease protein
MGCTPSRTPRIEDLTYFLWGAGARDGPVMGLVLNLLLSGVALAGGALLGVPLGVFRAVTSLRVHAPVALVLSVVRSTPLLLLVLWSFLFIQVVLRVPLDPLWIGCIALGMHAATHISDIVRAGTLAVSKAEVKTAQSLGLSRLQIATHVLVPVSMRMMIPAFASFGTSLFKDSSVCYVIGVMELMQLGVMATARDPQHLVQYYLIVGLIFFAVSTVGTRLAFRLEQRVKIRGMQS